MSYKREDFKVRKLYRNWMICCSTGRTDSVHLHSDGSVFAHCPEYWPTREHAEQILDEYYPKPKHVWKNGDVFKIQGYPMIYLCEGMSLPRVHHLTSGHMATCSIESYLKDATFLFNIAEKL